MVPDPDLGWCFLGFPADLGDENKAQTQLSERTFLCFVGKIIHFVAAGFMEQPERATLEGRSDKTPRFCVLLSNSSWVSLRALFTFVKSSQLQILCHMSTYRFSVL